VARDPKPQNLCALRRTRRAAERREVTTQRLVKTCRVRFRGYQVAVSSHVIFRALGTSEQREKPDLPDAPACAAGTVFESDAELCQALADLVGDRKILVLASV
jgi:hypothetical protein